MVTRSPRALSRLPRLLAVRPFPREDATPPVTNTCLVTPRARSTGIHGNTVRVGRLPPRRPARSRAGGLRRQDEEVGGNGASAPAPVPYCPVRPPACWAS